MYKNNLLKLNLKRRSVYYNIHSNELVYLKTVLGDYSIETYSLAQVEEVFTVVQNILLIGTTPYYHIIDDQITLMAQLRKSSYAKITFQPVDQELRCMLGAELQNKRLNNLML